MFQAIEEALELAMSQTLLRLKKNEDATAVFIDVFFLTFRMYVNGHDFMDMLTVAYNGIVLWTHFN